VQGGSFIMGATEKDKKYFVEQDKYSSSQVHVELDDFYISKCELTQHQWNNIIGNNIQLQQIDDKFPMYNISWNDCVKLIDTLTVLTGLQFAIPSEAQWEYAARGGNKSKDYLYSGSDAVEDVGWVSSLDNSLHKVGIMDGNELELCDMTGNVSEWCGDFFAEEYKEYNVKNPIGPKDGKLRVIRGGNICSEVYESKITTRQWANPNYPATYTGVRLVIIPK
jgi:formylglycine-generating enzyme required for sulfatase activity